MLRHDRRFGQINTADHARPCPGVERLERRVMLDAVPVGPELRINSVSTNDHTGGDVAMAANGDFVVAWQKYGQDPGDSLGIYARRFDASGVPTGDEFPVDAAGRGRDSSVAMDADGDFVISWFAPDTAFDDGIFARRFGADGQPIGAEFRVNTHTTGAQHSASIAMHSDGDFVIAWVDGGSRSGIHAQRYGADGQPQGGEFQVNGTTGGQQGSSSVAMDADGDFVIAWWDIRPGSNRIVARRYSAAGVAQGGDFHVNTYSTDHKLEPDVGMDAAGNFVVTWRSDGQDGSGAGIFARRYNSAGAPLTDDVRVNTYTNSDQMGPNIAVSPAGDFVVTWMSNGQDGSDFGTYARRYNPSGVPEGDEFRVNTYTTGNQWTGPVATNMDGDFVITWKSDAPDGPGRGIYAQRYAVVPAVTASSFLFETAPHRLQYTFDENLSNSLGTDDLVVQNLTTGHVLPSTDFTLAYDLATRTATFTYTGGAGGLAGVLADANYRATLLAAGTTLPADHVLLFRFLRGDATGDGVVNLRDFNVLAANFGQSNRTFSQGDFNYDSVVNLRDFNILAGRFGAAVGPGAAHARRNGTEREPSIEPADLELLR